MNHDGHCWTTLRVKEAEILFKTEDRSILELNIQLPGSLAYYFKFTNGKVILIPNSLDPQSTAILFDSEGCYHANIHRLSALVPHREKSYIDQFQADIVYKNKIKTEHLLPLLNLRIQINEIDKSSIGYIINALRKKWKKFSPRSRLFSTLLLGEYLRLHHKGQWMYLKKYGSFYSYYEPILTIDSKAFILFDSAHSYWDSSTMSLQVYRDSVCVVEGNMPLDYYLMNKLLFSLEKATEIN